MFHQTFDESLIAYSRRVPAELSPTGREDTILTIVNLDPHSTREATIKLDMVALGYDWHDSFVAHDLLSGASWQWGEYVYVRLGPDAPAHVVHIRRN